MCENIVIGFINGKVFYDKLNFITISETNISAPLNKFKNNVFWKIKIGNYSKSKKTLYVNVLSYESDYESFCNQDNYIYPVLAIVFGHIDTGHLISCNISSSKPKPKLPPPSRTVVARPIPPQVEKPPQRPVIEPLELKKVTVKLDIKVPIVNLSYHDGYVTFSTKTVDLNKLVPVRVDNPLIRKEFGAVSNYLSKALEIKNALFEVWALKETDQLGRVHSVQIEKATSEDINRIDSSIIEEANCGFLVDSILGSNVKIKDSHRLRTPEDLMGELLGKSGAEDAPSAEVIMERAFKFKAAKHHLQLKYLASKHMKNIFKLRFSISPFSFLFLVEGCHKYFFVLEAFNDNLATYVWVCENNPGTLRVKFLEVEQLMSAFEEANRERYLSTKPEGFHRVFHNYTNEIDGFIRWKEGFEEVLRFCDLEGYGDVV